jgi:hypothetical protein
LPFPCGFQARTFGVPSRNCDNVNAIEVSTTAADCDQLGILGNRKFTVGWVHQSDIGTHRPRPGGQVYEMTAFDRRLNQSLRYSFNIVISEISCPSHPSQGGGRLVIQMCGATHGVPSKTLRNWLRSSLPSQMSLFSWASATLIADCVNAETANWTRPAATANSSGRYTLTLAVPTPNTYVCC